MPSLLVAIALAAPAAVSYDAGLFQETRAASDGRVELQLSPFLGLAGAHSRAKGSVRYAPRFVRQLHSPSAGAGWSEALQRIELAGEALDRGAGRIFVEGHGAYGRTDLSPLAAVSEGALPPLDRPMQLQSLRFMSADAAAGIEERLASRLSLRTTLSYGMSGAARASDRARLPLLQVLRLDSHLGLRASRADSFSLGLGGSLSRLEPVVSRSWTLDGSLGWERRLSASLAGSLAAGVSALRSTDVAQTQSVRLRPTAAALLRGRTAKGKLDLALGARIVPFVDPVDGSLSLRPEGTGQADLTVLPRLAFSGATAIAPVKGLDGRRRPYAVASLAALFRPHRAIQLSAGTRVAAQPDVRASVFVALSLIEHGGL